MSAPNVSDDPTVAALTATEYNTLRRAQLAQTVVSLRMAADRFDELRQSADVGDDYGDVAAYMRTVRVDLGTLEALGYVDDES